MYGYIKYFPHFPPAWLKKQHQMLYSRQVGQSEMFKNIELVHNIQSEQVYTGAARQTFLA